MVNEILSIFDTDLSSKCWIGKYGRLAITAKQSVDGTFKKYPVSCHIDPEECEYLDEFLVDLIPDDSTAGVSFWKYVTPTTYSAAPGISRHRGIRKAETVLEFVVWVNLHRVTGEINGGSWCTDQDSIIRDALKTLDCKRGKIDSGLSYIKHLKLEVIRIGNTDTWKQAMSEYSIDNLEALTMWPYSAFTLTVKLSYLVNSNCIEDFNCTTEINCDMPQPKIFKATIKQTGTDAPVLTILKNNFTGITCTYVGEGDFRILNTASEFTKGKTIVHLPFTDISTSFGTMGYIWNSASSIGLSSYSDTEQLVAANGVFGSSSLNGTPITIEVWP